MISPNKLRSTLDKFFFCFSFSIEFLLRAKNSSKLSKRKKRQKNSNLYEKDEDKIELDDVIQSKGKCVQFACIFHK